jgi:hypothetical protein
VIVLTLLAVIAAVAGRHWLLLDYDLSRDEQMATFDAWIYAHGHLAWPLPPEWRADFPMLNNLFMLPVGKPVAWISAYLPGHTGLRALVGLIAPGWLGGPAFTGPLMLGASLWLLWSIARTMLTREGASVAVLMLLLSGQSLFASMSAFAMPAHLAVNLLWLRLFLANRPVPILPLWRWASSAPGCTSRCSTPCSSRHGWPCCWCAGRGSGWRSMWWPMAPSACSGWPGRM